MHTKTQKKRNDLPFVAGESLSHDHQRGRAWFQSPSRPANPLRHSSSGCVGSRPTAGSAASHVRASRVAGENSTTEPPRTTSRQTHDHSFSSFHSNSNYSFTTRLSAFSSAGLRPSLRPVFGSASLRASARSLSKGGVPSRSPSTPCRAGAGGVSFGSGPGNYSPKIRPLPYMTSDL